MYPLFESIKVIDRQVKHLPWHQQRFERSYQVHYGFSPEIDLRNLICVPKHISSHKLFKLRFLYNDTSFQIEILPYIHRKVKTLKLVQDNSISYDLKYCDRSKIERLFAQRSSCDEILIVRDGMITDTSFSNVVFYDGHHWYTPKNPLLQGTCRNRLLFEKKIKEAQIRPEDLYNYQYVALINAMSDHLDRGVIEVKNISI